MKQCSEALIKYMTDTDNFVTYDLYSFRLISGEEYNFTSGDSDISYGSRKYIHTGPIIIRDQTKITGAPSVDSLDLTIYAPESDGKNPPNTNILEWAHNGLLDDATAVLERAYFEPDTGVLVGVLKLFTGQIEVKSAGGISLKLEARSKTTGLSQLFPVRIFAPGKAYIKDENGIIISSSTDKATCAIPLKPSQNILSRGVF